MPTERNVLTSVIPSAVTTILCFICIVVASATPYAIGDHTTMGRWTISIFLSCQPSSSSAGENECVAVSSTVNPAAEAISGSACMAISILLQLIAAGFCLRRVFPSFLSSANSSQGDRSSTADRDIFHGRMLKYSNLIWWLCVVSTGLLFICLVIMCETYSRFAESAEKNPEQSFSLSAGIFFCGIAFVLDFASCFLQPKRRTDTDIENDEDNDDDDNNNNNISESLL